MVPGHERLMPLSIRSALRSAASMQPAALVPAAPARALALAQLDARARDYAAASHAPNTLRAYASDLRTFVAWCRPLALTALPAEPRTVARYLAALADASRKPSTIARALTAINIAHVRQGFPAPREANDVRDAWRGVRRVLSVAPQQKAPLLIEDLRAVATALPSTLHGLRDRAILVLGWAMGARRSEVVTLEVTDLRLTAEGFEVTIRRSKIDQEGEGHKLGVPYGSTPATCPVRTVLAWRAAAGVEAGPLFRSLKNGRPTSRARSTAATWRGSSRPRPHARASRPPTSPAIRCARASSRRRRGRARPSATSCGTRSTARPRRCASTSAPQSCSRRATPRRGSASSAAVAAALRRTFNR